MVSSVQCPFSTFQVEIPALHCDDRLARLLSRVQELVTGQVAGTTQGPKLLLSSNALPSRRPFGRPMAALRLRHGCALPPVMGRC
jgi:hypothetical protein